MNFNRMASQYQSCSLERIEESRRTTQQPPDYFGSLNKIKYVVTVVTIRLALTLSLRVSTESVHKYEIDSIETKNFGYDCDLQLSVLPNPGRTTKK